MCSGINESNSGGWLSSRVLGDDGETAKWHGVCGEMNSDFRKWRCLAVFLAVDVHHRSVFESKQTHNNRHSLQLAYVQWPSSVLVHPHIWLYQPLKIHFVSECESEPSQFRLIFLSLSLVMRSLALESSNFMHENWWSVSFYMRLGYELKPPAQWLMVV